MSVVDVKKFRFRLEQQRKRKLLVRRSTVAPARRDTYQHHSLACAWSCCPSVSMVSKWSALLDLVEPLLSSPPRTAIRVVNCITQSMFVYRPYLVHNTQSMMVGHHPTCTALPVSRGCGGTKNNGTERPQHPTSTAIRTIKPSRPSRGTTAVVL